MLVAESLLAPRDADSGRMVSDAPDLLAAGEPHRVLRAGNEEYWDAPLADILQFALANVAVIRDRGQFLSPSNPLLAAPETVPSGFDPALQEFGGPFGGRGVEAALADFDASFAAAMLWGRDERIQNNRFLSGGLAPGDTLGQQSAAFNARLDQPLPTGGLISVGHFWDYSLNNMMFRLYPSVYVGTLRTEFRQPLWAGAGYDFTEIAGPVWRLPQGAQVNQGVSIARLNTKVSVLEFEARVLALLRNVEEAWWDLALAYRAYASEAAARDMAEELWRQVQGRAAAGLEGTGAADEAQARENYLERCTLADEALATLYQREAQLRRLVGLPVNDGALIRPADELEVDAAAIDWHQLLAEALTSRVELRRQQSLIQGLCAQLRAAGKLAQPRLDFVSGYQLNGFGDDLIGDFGEPPFPNAYETLFDNRQTGWNLGFEFSMPLGFRASRATVRNLEIRLAKARAVLSAQELEISHELAHAIQQRDRWLAALRGGQLRLDAARQRVAAHEADYRAGRASVDLLLRAAVSQTQAELAVHRALAEYRKTLAEINFRAGRLLAQHNITLAEGVWQPNAYAAALKHNLERVRQPGSAAPPLPVGSHLPPQPDVEPAAPLEPVSKPTANKPVAEKPTDNQPSKAEPPTLDPREIESFLEDTQAWQSLPNFQPRSIEVTGSVVPMTIMRQSLSFNGASPGVAL
jgi:outer membrane protein TolC